VIRVLFFCEPCTLSHVVRPLAYARLLGADEFECHVACAYDVARHCAPGERWRFHPVSGCVTAAEFAAALARGALPYDREVIERYVQEDLRLLDEVKPDVVVGDFRLSLGISAPSRGVPYVALINAVWSPLVRRRFPVPELPITRRLGPLPAALAFPLLRPIVFAQLAAPFNRARRAHGLPPFGGLLETYSWGDFTAYPDMPELFDMAELSAAHRFLGALRFGPHVPLPDWWERVPTSRPWVYVAMGSSGRAGALPAIVEALAGLDVEIIAATSERGVAAPSRPNVWTSEWLPLDPVLARARVAIGNGGAGGVYYALHHGVPILSVPANMDQHMMAEAVVRSGAGRLVRSDRASPRRIRDATVQLLEEQAPRERARSLGSAMAARDPGAELAALLRQAGS
jgi:UDP:flavonoid glycosyltransferase YjiC (YdhE family)